METGDPEGPRRVYEIIDIVLEMTSNEEISGLINHLIGFIGHPH